MRLLSDGACGFFRLGMYVSRGGLKISAVVGQHCLKAYPCLSVDLFRERAIKNGERSRDNSVSGSIHDFNGYLCLNNGEIRCPFIYFLSCTCTMKLW
jgi:hypothetical protein